MRKERGRERGVQMNVWVSQGEYERISELSREYGISMSGLARAALRYALSKPDFLHSLSGLKSFSVHQPIGEPGEKKKKHKKEG